jgi:Glutathione-dependent formaldehyde-activating enzyme
LTPLYDGGCACRQIRYRMTTRPLFVHCCHCTWCQRETGAAFALNAMIEADRVQLLQGELLIVLSPATPAVAEYYKAADYWPKDSLERRALLLAKISRDSPRK